MSASIDDSTTWQDDCWWRWATKPKHSDTRLRHQIENRLRDGLLAARQIWKRLRHR
jgi:hypothetical protein